MIKAIDSPSGNFVQKCGSCGAECLHMFASLSIAPGNNRVLSLPKCKACNSSEFLILNYGSGDHDLKVAQVFAEVNAV